MFVKLLHPLNAYSPIDVTEGGIVNDVRFMQLQKAVSLLAQTLEPLVKTMVVLDMMILRKR